jgi:hypothetical protein
MKRKPYWAGILLSSAIALAVTFWLPGLTDRLAAAAGLIGLVVGVAGFALTLRGQDDLREAIAKAREETRRAVERIGLQASAWEAAALSRRIADCRSACLDRQWLRAQERLQEAILSAIHLAGSPHLSEVEKAQTRAAADDFGSILLFIETRRLGAGATARPDLDLSGEHLNSLLSRIIELENLRIRLHYLASEVTDVNQP